MVVAEPVAESEVEVEVEAVEVAVVNSYHNIADNTGNHRPCNYHILEVHKLKSIRNRMLRLG